MRAVAIAVSLLALSACHGSHASWSSDDTGKSKDVHIALAATDGNSQVALNIPGFNATLSLPDLALGDHLDLNGIKLAPNSKVGNVDIVAHDHDGGSKGSDGNVRVDFTNPDAPAALIAYYGRAATDAGYATVTSDANGLTAHKGGKQFALAVQPRGGGSAGRITITGSD